ncbi:MAG: tetratricopeptide repeat protein, partial [Oscillospiraceae bacterium]|nr:tetratricopeptide repeat protein [Oscillospiraceae bacterium]
MNAAAPPSVAPGVYSAPATPAAQVRAKKLSPVIIGVAAAALVVAVAVTVFVLNALKPWQSSGDALSDAGGKTPSGQADVSEVETLLVLGQEHLSAGEYDEAITAFTSAIALDGELTEAYVGRGDAYAGLARYGDAAADYERALELDDSDKSVATKLGAAQNRLE